MDFAEHLLSISFKLRMFMYIRNKLGMFLHNYRSRTRLIVTYVGYYYESKLTIVVESRSSCFAKRVERVVHSQPMFTGKQIAADSISISSVTLGKIQTGI